MEKMDVFRGPNAKFLPNKIVTDRMSLLDGNDRIDIYYFGRGHTDGDLVVVVPGEAAGAPRRSVSRRRQRRSSTPPTAAAAWRFRRRWRRRLPS